MHSFPVLRSSISTSKGGGQASFGPENAVEQIGRSGGISNVRNFHAVMILERSNALSRKLGS